MSEVKYAIGMHEEATIGGALLACAGVLIELLAVSRRVIAHNGNCTLLFFFLRIGVEIEHFKRISLLCILQPCIQIEMSECHFSYLIF